MVSKSLSNLEVTIHAGPDVHSRTRRQVRQPQNYGVEAVRTDAETKRKSLRSYIHLKITTRNTTTTTTTTTITTTTTVIIIIIKTQL